MGRIYTIQIDAPKDDAYRRTESVKRSILDGIKRDYPHFTKDQVVTVITNPNTLKVITFRNNIRLRAKLIESSNPSDGMLFIFDDKEMGYAFNYLYKDTQGINLLRFNSEFPANEKGLYENVIEINKGAFYKLKFYICCD